VSFAVPEATSETPDPVAIDHTVTDEPHRSGDDVATYVPLGRTR
jgi:hypothetical protein